MIQVDGSYGEGGGQLIRTAVSLAALTGQAVEIVNIRAGRTKPGLQPQHLMSVRAAAQLCGARLRGDAAQSVHLLFEPSHFPTAGSYRFDIGTAGATTLVAQTVLVPLALARGHSAVDVVGGTHNPHAPTADYVRDVYLPELHGMGIEGSVEYERAGFYPQGGGELKVGIGHHRLVAFDRTTRGRIVRVTAHIVTSGLPASVGERAWSTIGRALEGRRLQAVPRLEDRHAMSPGAAVTLVVECEGVRAGFSALGERGKRMETVAEEAVRQLLDWLDREEACEEHLADQLALPAAVARGESRWSTTVVSEHLRTVLWLIQKFVPVEVELIERADGAGSVRLSSPGIAGP